ncbi:MAG: tetratricopeptide repeat protein [Nitrososphaeraceae archaeon]
MRDIDVLEEKWKIYKYKQFVPYIIIAILFLVIFVYFLSKDDMEIKKAVDFEIIGSNINIDKEIVEKRMPLAIHGDLNVLEPEIVYNTVIEKICIKKSAVDYLRNFNDNNISIVKKEEKNSIKTNQVKSLVESNKDSSDEVCLALPDVKIDEKPVKSKKIKFDIVDNGNALSDIMRRFNSSKDPNDALFLSNSFYESGDYAKSLFWAIETNKITEDIEDGWLLMAKSKAKLGDKGEALRILRAYSAKKTSNEALELAREIESNEWK